MPEIEKNELLSEEEWAFMEKNKAYDDSSSTKEVLDNLVEERDIIKQVEDDEMFMIVNEDLEDKDFNFKANNNKIAKKANILIVDDVIPNLFEIFTTSGTVVPGGDLGLDPIGVRLRIHL